MNQSEFKKGIRGFKKLGLTKQEKNLVLKNILGEVPNYKAQPSWFSTFEILFSRTAPVFLVVLVVFGTLAFGSEKAVPGEGLYPIKVGLVEPLRSAIEITPEAKAEWEKARSVRRLDEALELAVKGEFNEKAREDIEKRFEKHVESFDALIEKMPANATSSRLAEIEFEEEIASKVNVISGFENKINKKGKEEAGSGSSLGEEGERAVMMMVAPAEDFSQSKSTNFDEQDDDKEKEDSELKKFKRKIEERLEKRNEERSRNREKDESKRD